MLSRGRPQALRRLITLLALLLIGSVLAAACGKKGPPRLPDAKAPPGVRDLAAVQEGQEIVLRWTGFAAAGYQVYRSAEPEAEEACEGCPILFAPVAKVPLTGEEQTPQPLVHREPSLSGTRYRFKVVPYDAHGQLGADSNIARLSTE